MFENVLLPTDFSPDSERVLSCVRGIPGVKKVTLLHVVDATRPSLRGWEHGPKIENAKILLEESRQVLEKSGIAADVIVDAIVDTITQGDVPRTILETAETREVSLIAMGARGKNTIREILLGSVSAGVIRHAGTPVLLMRSPPESCTADTSSGLFSRVLVPVDFSAPSRDPLAVLGQIPSPGRVVLLHVVDKGESAEEIQAAIAGAKERLAGMQKELAAAGVDAEAMVHVGYPPDDIIATADRSAATLILMSPHGEGWTRELRTLFIGSTTNAVVRRATRPVLITAGSRSS
ncbi:universal stress protein [Methanoregula sp. PtaU1.Bin006]|uniref:universal stress protein n=1 Tax=Methanoregula sp. PtaU1.Bin006 TaxID=1811681 RepID=UPI002600092C|nr:universal stress protein [Methanoregula sp. PtaU1.Bin006]